MLPASAALVQGVAVGRLPLWRDGSRPGCSPGNSRSRRSWRTCAPVGGCGWVAGYPGSVGAWRPVPEVTTGALATVSPDFTVGAPARLDDVVVTLWTASR